MSFTPNSLASLVKSAISSHSPLFGRAIHGKIIRTMEYPLPSFLTDHLINMYSKLHLLNSAQLVLKLNPARSVVSWTAIIAGFVQTGNFISALLHFSSMCRDFIFPNDFTLPCVFKASTSLCLPITGKQLHAFSIKCGLILDEFVGCSAFDMYSKSGLKTDAMKMFDEMPTRSIAMWNTSISNAVTDGNPKNGIDSYIELRRMDGKPDSITFCVSLKACADGSYLNVGKQLHGFVIRSGFDTDMSVCNGLIDCYGKCKEVKAAEMVFDRMVVRNDVSWCTVMVAYMQNHEEEKACETFIQSRKVRIEPTGFIVSTALSACAGMNGLEMGRSVHGVAVKACVEGNIYIGSALVDMYGKCGSIEDSERVFNEMPEKNLVSWNSMIGGYAHQGEAGKAMALFEEITTTDVHRGLAPNLVPNYVTLVCVLSACSRAGAVEKGMTIFDSMREKYGIEPGAEHYACVVDMFGRAGMVDRAYEFIKKMPVPIRPTVSVWGALLNACRVYGKPELGTIAAENLFKLDPKDSGNHVLLSNLFAASGRWDEANSVRQKMKDVGIKKGAGFSWITVGNKVHNFQAKDTTHERNLEIQAMLCKITRKMEAAGYVADTKFALYDLEEEEKITEVGYHSEKIALAFGLIVVPSGVPIRITKNLRICGDCHSAFKFVSRIAERDIVVRDNNRFHRFVDGECSCRDYW